MIHVLLVDDEAELRTLLADYLERYGLRVTTLATGAELRRTVTSGPPYVQRGTPYSPDGSQGTPGAAYRGGYDPTSGVIDGVTDANGNPVRLGDQGNLSVLGDDSWKWLLVGPVVEAP